MARTILFLLPLLAACAAAETGEAGGCGPEGCVDRVDHGEDDALFLDDAIPPDDLPPDDLPPDDEPPGDEPDIAKWLGAATPSPTYSSRSDPARELQNALTELGSSLRFEARYEEGRTPQGEWWATYRVKRLEARDADPEVLLDELGKRIGRCLLLDPALRGRRLTLKLKQPVSWSRALEEVAAALDAEVESRCSVVVLCDATPVTLKEREIDLRRAIRIVARAGGIENMAFDPSFPRRLVDVDLRGVPWSAALDRLISLGGAFVREAGPRGLRVVPAADE
jgi:hypothetical protein